MADECRDKRDIHTLTSIHNPPAEGNFCDEKGNVIGPHIVEDYNLHMVYVDKADRMANSTQSGTSRGNGQRNCSSIC
jgi:hypothetical protein